MSVKEAKKDLFRIIDQKWRSKTRLEKESNARAYCYTRDALIAMGGDTRELNFPKSLGECNWNY